METNNVVEECLGHQTRRAQMTECNEVGILKEGGQ